MVVMYVCLFFFLFKQKTAYEMRISDWSSDVCSSDLGLAGRAFHAPLIAAVAGLDLVAIASSRAEEIARDWPGMRTADADAILAGPDIDLVVIATPNPTHAPLACAAIAAGDHVVIDKPLAPDAGGGAAAIGRAHR